MLSGFMQQLQQETNPHLHHPPPNGSNQPPTNTTAANQQQSTASNGTTASNQQQPTSTPGSGPIPATNNSGSADPFVQVIYILLWDYKS